jgi:cytochrome c-type biogenesis protein CcmH
MTPMRRLLVSLGLLILAAAGPAVAVQPDEMLKDPALEARARALSAELRCMVCQNQSIDDSDAPLAHDLRVLLRERIAAGDTDAEVVDFLVARYGEFILLTPRLSVRTVLLWSAPVVLLVLGGVVAWGAMRRKPVTDLSAPAGLTDKERAELDRILSKPG